MSRNAIFTAAMKRPANVTRRTRQRIGAEALADALGAAETAPVPSRADTPLGFVALRQELARTLRSTGGRPGLPDAERRKIPVTEAVWSAMAQAALDMAAPGFHPTPAQVASAVLELAVRDMPQLTRDAHHALHASPAPKAEG